MADHVKNPGARFAQRSLAFEVTKLAHGEEVAHLMSSIAMILFGEGMTGELEPKIKAALLDQAPGCKIDIGENIIRCIAEIGTRFFKARSS